jgi:hypothetical protein
MNVRSNEGQPVRNWRVSIWRRWAALLEQREEPEPEKRTDRLLSLWSENIPGVWRRGLDLQLLGPRYRRGDLHAPQAGEHTIERQILVSHFGRINLFGGRLVDGVNALPLTRDPNGHRYGNVEADLYLPRAIGW